MVKVTFEQDGCTKEEVSGDFVLAIVCTIEEDRPEGIGMAYGNASDMDSVRALAGFIKYGVNKVISPDSKKAAYKILRATIDTEIKWLEAEESAKEEAPEAATSGESGK